MAIKETSKKIHFIPFTGGRGREVDDSPAPTITINRKNFTVLFSTGAVREMGLDGKFIRFYFEPIKKVIGWQVRDIVKQNEMKVWKLVKASKVGGWQCSIGKLLKQFDGRLKKELYKGVPIQKYREANSLSEYNGQVFYFVELVDDPEELKKGVGNDKLAAMSVA